MKQKIKKIVLLPFEQFSPNYILALTSAVVLSGCSFGAVPVDPGMFIIQLFFGIVAGTTVSHWIHRSYLVSANSMTANRVRDFFCWTSKNRQELTFFILLIMLTLFFTASAWGQVRIPGSDESAKLKAAGTLLMLMDTALFVWLARIFAGLCVLSAGWLIKEQKFGPAVVCVVGALVIGTSPMWVQNIFEIGGGGGVFK